MAAASALGILAAQEGGFGPGVCGIGLALAGAVTLACLAARRTRCAGAALILSVAALGAYSASLEITPPPDSLRRILLAGDIPPEGKVLLFHGIVFERVPRGQAARNAPRRYIVEVTGLRAGMRLGSANGSIYLDTPAVMPWGSIIEGKAYFHIPAAPANPGQFDYARFLELRGITCLARAPAEGLIRIVGKTSRHRFRRVLAAARRSFSKRLSHLGLASLGIIPAVLLGERAGLDATCRQSFIRSGTMHLLAISGLHLGIVVGLVWWVLRSVGVPAKGASFVSIVAAVCYAFLAGARPPVVRAALMAVFFFLALITSRRALVLSVVSTAALVMLVWKPLELFKPGFQMSFAAVLGLSYLGGPLAGRLGGLVSKGQFPAAVLLHKALRVTGYSTGAWLGVVPLAAYHFHAIAFISPLANIVLIPITSVMVTAGFLASGLSLVSMRLGEIVGLSASGAEMTLAAAAGLLAKVPGMYHYVGAFSAGWVIAAYAFLILCAVLAAAGRRILPLVIAGFVVANLLLWPGVLLRGEGPGEIDTLAAYGKAAVVLIDGKGNVALFVDRQVDEYFASAVICPFLVARGVPKVDLLVETSGADARIQDCIRERLPLGRVLRQRRFRGTSPGGQSNPVEYIGAGSRVSAFGSVRIAFHSARAKDFLNASVPYFEGLVAEVDLGGHRAVIALDVTGGCLQAVSSAVAARPDVVCVVSYGGSQADLHRWQKNLCPCTAITVEPDAVPPPRSARIILAETPEVVHFHP